MSWRLVYTKAAHKDAKLLAAAGLKAKAQALLDVLAEDPFRSPPPFEKLVGDLSGAYARRINIQHRLVYQVVEEEHAVKVLRMWSHQSVVRNESVNELLRERRAVSPEMAIRLSALFGNSAEFWLNLQRSVDLYDARTALKEDVQHIKRLSVA